MKPENLAVFVTGCDTGFGNLLARKLDKAKFKVLAGCLFLEGEGAKQLLKDCSSRLRIVKLDVTSDSDVNQAYKVVEDEMKSTNHGKFILTSARQTLTNRPTDRLSPFRYCRATGCGQQRWYSGHR